MASATTAAVVPCSLPRSTSAILIDTMLFTSNTLPFHLISWWHAAALPQRLFACHDRPTSASWHAPESQPGVRPHHKLTHFQRPHCRLLDCLKVAVMAATVISLLCTTTACSFSLITCESCGAPTSEGSIAVDVSVFHDEPRALRPLGS